MQPRTKTQEELKAEAAALRSRIPVIKRWASNLRSPEIGANNGAVEAMTTDNEYTPHRPGLIKGPCFMTEAPTENASLHPSLWRGKKGFKKNLDQLKNFIENNPGKNHLRYTCSLALPGHMTAMSIDIIRMPNGKIRISPYFFNSLGTTDQQNFYYKAAKPFFDAIAESFSTSIYEVSDPQYNTQKLQKLDQGDNRCGDWAPWFEKLVGNRTDRFAKSPADVLNDELTNNPRILTDGPNFSAELRQQHIQFHQNYAARLEAKASNLENEAKNITRPAAVEVKAPPAFTYFSPAERKQTQPDPHTNISISSDASTATLNVKKERNLEEINAALNQHISSSSTVTYPTRNNKSWSTKTFATNLDSPALIMKCTDDKKLEYSIEGRKTKGLTGLMLLDEKQWDAYIQNVQALAAGKVKPPVLINTKTVDPAIAVKMIQAAARNGATTTENLDNPRLKDYVPESLLSPSQGMRKR